jgi:hypothetical protein
VRSRRRRGEEDLSAVPVDELIFGVVDTPATSEDVKWDNLAEDARFTSLNAVQSTAERWGATILVITGLLTALTVVRGPDDLNALRDTMSKVEVGVLSAASLLVALASVVLAASAAQGHAVKVQPTGERYRKATLLSTQSANRKLTWSRYLALVIIPLYLAALGLMAYSPQKSDAGPVISITDSDGVMHCGLVKIRNHVFFVVNDHGVVNRIPAARVSSVIAVAECK